MITINRTTHVGTILGQLRRNAGLTMRQLAPHAHISVSGISKREHHRDIPLTGLVDHAQALGYHLALIPTSTRRTTGTGWPEP